VKTARLHASGNRISIEVDERVGGVTVVQTGRGGFSRISVGRNYGVVAGSVVSGMVMGGGRMVVGGRRRDHRGRPSRQRHRHGD
jgi:hypothetical protein